jgi:ABC-type nitrate/sulfonate/bicarbonate transport system permease component
LRGEAVDWLMLLQASPGDAAVRAGLPPRAQAWLLGLAGAAAALVVWTWLAHLLEGGGGVINRLPTPHKVARERVAYASADLAVDLVSSLRVFGLGWLIGAGLATLVGLVLGRVQALGNVFLPVIEAIRPVSSIAWVPLSVVWFGFGLSGKVFLVGLAVFLVVIVYAVDGSRRIPPDLARTADMLGMSGWQRFASLVLPGTLTEVLIGSRVSLMAGWGTVIVAELVAADTGLGAHLIAVEQSYDVPAVMATMVCLGLTGFVMNALFTLLERRLMPWRHEAPLRRRARASAAADVA